MYVCVCIVYVCVCILNVVYYILNNYDNYYINISFSRKALDNCIYLFSNVTFNGLTVNTCGVVSRIQVEHIGEWITLVAERRAVDRKRVLQEHTFCRIHIAFAQCWGIRSVNNVGRIRKHMCRPN